MKLRDINRGTLRETCQRYSGMERADGLDWIASVRPFSQSRAEITQLRSEAS
jgi:hypothetical protein